MLLLPPAPGPDATTTELLDPRPTSEASSPCFSDAACPTFEFDESDYRLLVDLEEQLPLEENFLEEKRAIDGMAHFVCSADCCWPLACDSCELGELGVGSCFGKSDCAPTR